jgi:membrane-bound metal-dependent hydrolase YbcI (DUF457 family)
MPVTPLHYPLAWILSKADRRLPLPGLVVGCVIPDIEVPILWYFFSGVLPDHLVLHSLIGGLTLGTLLALVISRLLYAPIISVFFGVDRSRLDHACRVTPSLVAACFLGVLSHLLLDYTMHWFNPILWPWVDPFVFVGPIVLFFAQGGPVNGTAFWMANFVVSAAMVVGWLSILMFYLRRNLWENIWLGSPED